MCCHPSLTPASAIPLTLRAVGGLTTGEIAAAFLVPESTMAQRISRAKAKVRASASRSRFRRPKAAERLRSVLHVLYVLFSEGYTTAAAPAWPGPIYPVRPSAWPGSCAPPYQKIRGGGAACLDAAHRRPTPGSHRPGGELIPLGEQDRTLWDRGLIDEGVTLITVALRRGPCGRIPGAGRDRGSPRPMSVYAATDWSEILSLYVCSSPDDRQPDGDAESGRRHRHGRRALRRARAARRPRRPAR